MTSTTSIDLSFERREMVILGTEYAGEMKKGVFTVMNFLMPKAGLLPMHCSANAGTSGDTALFFGLSGTGKTTLSTDPQRQLIGDDEHVWSAEGIFNIEGGCYAKCIDLTPEQEPEIFRAIRFGTVLENVVCDEENRRVNYAADAITENTRAAYPIDYIPNAMIPCTGRHPRDIIFLTCDAFGVLPPVSRLTPDQAMYHFMSGYTAKVAGTENGRHRARSHVFGLLWRGLHGLASEQIRRPTGRQNPRPQRAGLAGQHGLDGRTVRRGLAPFAPGHSGDYQRDSRWSPWPTLPWNGTPRFGFDVVVRVSGRTQRADGAAANLG